jgi:alpha-1,2-mannosyltransferase
MFAYSAIFLAIALVASIVWIALADGLIDRRGEPIGTDFSNVWAAGKLVLKGEPAAPYDPLSQHKAEIDAFDGKPVPFFGWHYPPLFLFAAAGLALLPYGWALLVWMLVTLPAYLLTVGRILPQPGVLLLACAYPAVFINLGHGQNGFLTAALMGGGLLLLNERPVLAGVIWGLLAYKPQFGLIIPVVLLATGQWIVIAAAFGTVLTASILTLAVFGPGVWFAFAESTAFTRTVVLEHGGTGWEKIQSIFSAVRMWGGSIESAYAAQMVLAAIVALSLIWLWRSRSSFDLKAAGLACGALLATPYVLDYDLVVLAISIAFVVRHGLRWGFISYEISALAFCWIAPIMARSIAETIHIPLGLVAMLTLYAVVIRRSVFDTTQQHHERLVEITGRVSEA